MTADGPSPQPILDVLAAEDFMRSLMAATGRTEVLLTSIIPDGQLKARLVTLGEVDRQATRDWLTRHDRNGANIYYHANEGPPGTRTRLRKVDVRRVSLLYVDIDRADGSPESREGMLDARAKFEGLPAHLAPFAVIPTGNGVQACWRLATPLQLTGEPGDPALDRAEDMSRRLGESCGGDSVANVDRLLRLPGTRNFPNEAKRRRGLTAVTQATVTMLNPASLLNEADLGDLCGALEGLQGIQGMGKKQAPRGARRPRPRSAHTGVDARIAELIDKLERAGARSIRSTTDLPPPAQASLQAALCDPRRKSLRGLWKGEAEDLVARGGDGSSSSLDMSVAANLKAATLSTFHVALALLVYEHGQAHGRYMEDDTARLRAVARAAVRSFDPADEPVDGDAGEEWSEPVDLFAMIPAPDVTAVHLPAAILELSLDIAERMDVQAHGVALAAIIVASAACHDGWRLQPKMLDSGWQERPVLWGAIVGDPSTAKSPAINEVLKPLAALERASAARHGEQIKEHAARVATLGKKAPHPPAPKRRRYIAQDATVEALSEILRTDAEARFETPLNKLLMHQDELGGFLGGLDQYKSGGRGGSERGHYLRAWNGGTNTVDRIARGSIYIPNWSFGMLGGIQPAVLRRFAEGAEDDGLLARFMYAVSDRPTVAGADRPPGEAVAAWDRMIRALGDMRPPPGHVCRFAPETADAWAEMEQLRCDAMVLHADKPRLKGHLGKWPTIWARLALVFHLVEHAHAGADGVPDLIARETAERATAWMRDIVLPGWIAMEAAIRGEGAEASPPRLLADAILALLTTGAIKATLTERDAYRAVGAFRGTSGRRVLAQAAEALVLSNWLRPSAHDGKRNPVGWDVHPKLAQHFGHRRDAEIARRKSVRKHIEFLKTQRRRSGEP